MEWCKLWVQVASIEPIEKVPKKSDVVFVINRLISQMSIRKIKEQKGYVKCSFETKNLQKWKTT